MQKPRWTGSRHLLPFLDLSPGDFERLCLWLLREEGFESVEHLGAAGADRGCDLSAIREGRRWAFQCKRVRRFGPRAAEKAVDEILKWPEEERPDELLFIVACNVTKEAQRRAGRRAGSVHCRFWPLTDLDERVKRHASLLAEFFQVARSDRESSVSIWGFHVGEYLQVVNHLVKRERIEDLAVPLLGVVETPEQESAVEVLGFVEEWLVEKQGKHLALLGEAGTGKSWLCLSLTKRLGEAFNKSPNQRPLPLLVSFRAYKSGMTLNEMIVASLARDYGQVECSSYRLRESIRQGRLVLILDGLDEMTRELGTRDALVQFAALGVPSACPTVVTCRSQYFLSGSEQREILNPDRDLVALEGAGPSFLVLHLRLLDQARANEAIRRRVGEDAGTRVQAFVHTTYKLPELCARPFLLDLVCSSYDALRGVGQGVTSADLYESYLNAWLMQELRRRKIRVRPDDVLRFVEGVAAGLTRSDSQWLSRSGFEAAVDAFAEGRSLVLAERDALKRELAASTFMSRTRDDGWTFSHKSFQEYLYARAFIRWERETGGVGVFPVTHTAIWQFVSQIVLREWDEEKALRWIVERVARGSERSLCRTTLHAAAAYWLIRQGSQAASEYRLRGAMLDTVDLKEVNLSDADLRDVIFHGSDLRGASLRGADLRHSILICANFSGADLTGADLRDSDCRAASFEGAKTQGVKWHRALVDGASRGS